MSRPNDLFRSAPHQTMAIAEQPRVRVRLDTGITLRAAAEAWDRRGARLTAELPWLRLGGSTQVELDSGVRQGRIDWIGMEPGPDGAARLAIHVTFQSGAERADTTLPYFFDEAIQQEVTEEEPHLPTRIPSRAERVLDLAEHITSDHALHATLFRGVMVFVALIALWSLLQTMSVR